MIVDTSQVMALAKSLASAGPQAVAAVTPVVGRGAMNVKEKARELAPTGPYLPMYARSISYDVTVDGLQVSAEIGPDKGRPQGALGNIIEYGTSNNAPIPHLGPALESEQENFERFVGDAVDKALRL